MTLYTPKMRGPKRRAPEPPKRLGDRNYEARLAQFRPIVGQVWAEKVQRYDRWGVRDGQMGGPRWRVVMTDGAGAVLRPVNRYDADRPRAGAARFFGSFARLQEWAFYVQPARHERLVEFGPFAGLTRDKIDFINAALSGHVVRVRSDGWDGKPEVGMFYGINRYDTGDRWGWANGGGGDLQILHGPWEGDPLAGPYSGGSRNIVSASLVTSFEVIGPRFTYCEHCGIWRLPSEMWEIHDDAWDPENGEYVGKVYERRCHVKRPGGPLWGECG